MTQTVTTREQMMDAIQAGFADEDYTDEGISPARRSTGGFTGRGMLRGYRSFERIVEADSEAIRLMNDLLDDGCSAEYRAAHPRQHGEVRMIARAFARRMRDNRAPISTGLGMFMRLHD